MEEIRVYLDKPDSMRLYSDGLALFKSHALALPDHSRHWQVISQGPFGDNRRILEDSLRAILQSKPTTQVMPATEITAKVTKPSSLIVKDQQQIDIYVELRKLRMKLKQTAQRFHDCNTDEERAQICDIISMVEKDIKARDGDLSYLQRFGRLPERILPEEDPLPDNIKALSKEINRVQSNILKVEARLQFLYDLPEHDRRRTDIPERQMKLDIYVSRKIAARKLIEKLKKDERQRKYDGAK